MKIFNVCGVMWEEEILHVKVFSTREKAIAYAQDIARREEVDFEKKDPLFDEFNPFKDTWKEGKIRYFRANDVFILLQELLVDEINPQGGKP